MLRGDLETVLLKALEKDRQRRYQSAADLARDLRQYLANQPIAARPPSAFYHFRKFAKRNKGLVAGVASAFVVLLVALAVVSLQARRIKREAESANAINAFFNDMLASVDPMQLRLFSGFAPDEELTDASIPHEEVTLLTTGGFGRDISVEQMMRLASANIDAKFVGKPLLKAQAHETMGMAFQSLWLYEEAWGHLRNALEIRRGILGDDHRETLRSMLQLGFSLRNSRTGRSAEAKPLVRSAYVGMRSLYGDDDPRTLTAARVLATVLADLWQYEESDRTFGETLTRQRRKLGEGHRDTLMTMVDWSYCRLFQGKWAEGQKWGSEAYEISSRALGPNDTITIWCELLMGVHLFLDGRHHDAETRLQGTLDKCKDFLGKDHPYTYLTKRMLALASWESEKPADLEKVYEEALAGQVATAGEEDRETLFTMRDFTVFLMTQGRFDEAIKLSRRAVDIWVRTRGEENTHTIAQMNLLACALRGAGEADEARGYVIRAINAGRQLAERSEANVWHLQQYASLLLTCEPDDLQDAPAALALAERAERKSDGKEHWVLDTLALAYFENDDIAQAVETQQRAINLLPPDSVWRTQFEANLAKYCAAATSQPTTTQPVSDSPEGP